MPNETLSKILYGIAVGDAVGNPLEFRRNITDEVFEKSWGASSLRISDDTQMSLYCWDSLRKTSNLGYDASIAELKNGYLSWLLTQGGLSTRAILNPPSDLLKFTSLFKVEAPGTTCMGALRSIANGLPVVNDSKGAGTVMRCAPIAWWACQENLQPDTAFNLARGDALITHQHPMAWKSSVVLVAIYLNLFKRTPFRLAVSNALAQTQYMVGQELTDIVEQVYDYPTFLHLRGIMGGWVAEEALTLAIGSVLHATNFKSVIKYAATTDGDSDTIAGIAGGLAACSGFTVPQHQIERLNALDAIDCVLSYDTQEKVGTT